MPNPTKDDERKLIGYVSDVADMVHDGFSPNEAIIKVASENSLPPWQIRLMVNAYNTGRSTEQRNSSNELFDKVATFEVADPGVILKAIYPEKIKTAAEEAREKSLSEEYDYDPDWMSERLAKKAAPALDYDWGPAADEYPRDPWRFEKKIRGGLHKLAQERERLAAALDELHDKAAAAFSGLSEYFRSTTAVPLEDARTNAEAAWGAIASDIFDKVAEMAACAATPPAAIRIKKPEPSKEKKPAKPVAVKRAFVANHAMDRRRAPYSYIDAIVKTSAAYDALLQEAADFEKGAFWRQLELERALVGQEAQALPADPTLSVMRRLHGEKRAFPGAGSVGEGAKLMLGAEAAKSIMNKLSPKPDEKLKSDSFADITDPSHETKLRSIRAQAALHGILNSPYFEGEDPRHVTSLFNDLTQMYPRMAEQPLLLETAMKRLAAQGSADTHDLDQLLGVETKLKQRDALPSGQPGLINVLSSGNESSPKSPRAGE